MIKKHVEQQIPDLEELSDTLSATRKNGLIWIALKGCETVAGTGVSPRQAMIDFRDSLESHEMIVKIGTLLDPVVEIGDTRSEATESVSRDPRHFLDIAREILKDNAGLIRELLRYSSDGRSYASVLMEINSDKSQEILRETDTRDKEAGQKARRQPGFDGGSAFSRKRVFEKKD